MSGAARGAAGGGLGTAHPNLQAVSQAQEEAASGWGLGHKSDVNQVRSGQVSSSPSLPRPVSISKATGKRKGSLRKQTEGKKGNEVKPVPFHGLRGPVLALAAPAVTLC